MAKKRPMTKQERIRRRRRKKRILRTAVLLLVMIFAVCLAVGAVWLIREKAASSTLTAPFTLEDHFAEGVSTRQRSEGFAANLCVSEGDVLLDDVVLDSGQTALLYDLSNCEVLYSKGALARVYPASITKIMTAMMVFKYGNLGDTVTITQENVTLEEGSQVCGFRAGDRLTMEQLLNCLLVYSGNDAASAIATHIGGSTEGFVEMMNNYARELGCTGTHFSNPHGLTDENHYTTPYDIYLMLKEALKYPGFTEITQQPSYTVEYDRDDGYHMVTYLEATDHYLTGEAVAPNHVSVLGGKTGTTSLAGNCLAILTQNAYGKPYISIVMGAETKDDLYDQMNMLLVHENA